MVQRDDNDRHCLDYPKMMWIMFRAERKLFTGSQRCFGIALCLHEQCVNASNIGERLEKIHRRLLIYSSADSVALMKTVDESDEVSQGQKKKTNPRTTKPLGHCMPRHIKLICRMACIDSS